MSSSTRSATTWTNFSAAQEWTSRCTTRSPFTSKPDIPGASRRTSNLRFPIPNSTQPSACPFRCSRNFGMTRWTTSSRKLSRGTRSSAVLRTSLGIECGAKLIAFEKPIALSMNEALEIRRAVRAAGVKTVVSHQHRYGDHYRKVKEIISSGGIGSLHTVYAHSVGWMLHLMTHLIDYMRWYNDNDKAEWVMGQAAGRGKLADSHPSPDYIAGFIQFANGVRGIIECGAGAPDIPQVDYWWRKNRIGAQGTEGFAEVLTGGGWRAATRDSMGVISGEGSMSYGHAMPP